MPEQCSVQHLAVLRVSFDKLCAGDKIHSDWLAQSHLVETIEEDSSAASILQWAKSILGTKEVYTLLLLLLLSLVS